VRAESISDITAVGFNGRWEVIRAAMDEFTGTSDNTGGAYDDFKKIKGIGGSIAMALVESGICRYQELASMTPLELTERLKDRVAFISPQRIQRDEWIAQAKNLAKGPPASASHPEKSLDKNGNNTTQDAGKLTTDSKRETWKELADFFVSFGYTTDQEGKERLQTRVHHSQAGYFNQWDGIATRELISWMLRQANLAEVLETKAGDPQPVKPGRLQPGPQPATLLELSYPRIAETEPAGKRQEQATHLRMESKLTVAGTRAEKLCQDRQPYLVEVHLVDLDTNQSERVASDKAQLSPGEQDYRIQMDFPIPLAGRYQLYLVASLLAEGGSVVYLQGPLVRVEP